MSKENGDQKGIPESIESSQNLKLIRQLANKDVDSDTILLINSGEVLTKEGIHGTIAPLGVGFGTGRHTSSRKLLTEDSCARRLSPISA